MDTLKSTMQFLDFAEAQLVKAGIAAEDANNIAHQLLDKTDAVFGPVRNAIRIGADVKKITTQPGKPVQITLEAAGTNGELHKLADMDGAGVLLVGAQLQMDGEPVPAEPVNNQPVSKAVEDGAIF